MVYRLDPCHAELDSASTMFSVGLSEFFFRKICIEMSTEKEHDNLRTSLVLGFDTILLRKITQPDKRICVD